jgi:hypothetical protein
MENNEMNRGTKEFDQRFTEYWHYKNHPQMMPFVGKHWNNSKKLLIIGESHYLEPGFDANIIKNWYDIPIDELVEEGKDSAYWWTNTANLIDSTDYKSKGHTLWRNIDKAVHETGFNPMENVFCYMAYANFFQRPAEKTGDSIKFTDEDMKIANEALDFNINIIKPNYLFFVSSKSWRYYDKGIFDMERTGHSVHPSCQWWNRKSSNFSKYFSKEHVTGKESFIDFIVYNKIFE